MIKFMTNTTISNEELLDILHKYGTIVLKTAYLFFKDKNIADDIYQDVFIKIYHKYPGFDDRIKEKAWVIKTTVNTCKDYVKTAWHRNVTLKDGNDDIILPADNTYSNTPETDCIKNEERKLIFDTVSNLPFRYKEIIILYYYHSYSTVEISRLTGKSEVAIRSRLSRARKAVEKILIKNGYKESLS